MPSFMGSVTCCLFRESSLTTICALLYTARMNLRRAIDAGETRRLYSEQGWTMAELAEHYGCAETTIRRRLEELGIPARQRGPQVSANISCKWSPQLAYAVGLIVTDGNLSSDRRHMSVVSKDHDLLETLRNCLGIENAITLHPAPTTLYRLQWGNRNFYDWLLSLGLMPAKSRRLGPLAIPDEYLADFMRGCIDGDGTIRNYTDRYNTFKSEKYVYERLFVSIVSASYPFLQWLRDSVARVADVHGALFLDKEPTEQHSALWLLKYAKHASIQLLRWMYYAPDVPCLGRKRAIAMPFLIESD